MSTILGIDPGSKQSGFAYLKAEEERGVWRFTFLRTGRLENDKIRDLVNGTHWDVLAIERVQGLVYSSKGNGASGHLIATADFAGELRGMGQTLARFAGGGKRVTDFTAREWRKALVGKPNPENNEITPVVLRLVNGWPKRSNNHERDAAGVAAFGVLVDSQGRKVA
jgi:Holliday junction resolvasome RuvABC endonuclease subunit